MKTTGELVTAKKRDKRGRREKRDIQAGDRVRTDAGKETAFPNLKHGADTPPRALWGSSLQPPRDALRVLE